MSAARGFAAEEIAARVLRAQAWMAESKTDALLLTTEAEVRYFFEFSHAVLAKPVAPVVFDCSAVGRAGCGDSANRRGAHARGRGGGCSRLAVAASGG